MNQPLTRDNSGTEWVRTPNVRSAVEGLRERFKSRSAIDSLRDLDKWFPVFAEQCEGGKK